MASPGTLCRASGTRVPGTVPAVAPLAAPHPRLCWEVEASQAAAQHSAQGANGHLCLRSCPPAHLPCTPALHLHTRPSPSLPTLSSLHLRSRPPPLGPSSIFVPILHHRSQPPPSCLTPTLCSEGPGAASACRKAHQHGITILEKELIQLKLPDISGDFRLRQVGKVNYELSRLDLHSFHLPYSRISLVPNVGLQVSISNAFASINGNWRVKLYFIRDHGSFDLRVENIYIKINLKLGRNASGKPTIDTSDCSTRVSKVWAHFSGKFGWLYNLFYSAVESRFRKILEGKVCDIVDSSVRRELQPYLWTLPVTSKIDDKVGIDYALVAPPTATAQSLDVDLKGEFFSLAHRSAVPFSPLPLALPPDHDRMVYFGASSYFFNTAGFVYHEDGLLVFEITDSVIPKDVEFHLTTSTFSAFIPQLEEMYPNASVKLRLSAPSAPFLSIGPGGLSLTPVVDIQAYAILPDTRLAPLFLLSLTGNVSAVINMTSSHIVGNLTVGRMKLSLKHSDVGTFQVRMLQSIMNIYASNILLPRLNERLAQGFPLPLPDRIQLYNILVQLHQNFLLLGADVHYQPRGWR